jgi:hypothetical protein
LRRWLKTNPNLAALNEKPKINQNSYLQTQNNRFDSFSTIPEIGYFSIVCQICAIGSTSKNTKILIVWDGTKSK